MRAVGVVLMLFFCGIIGTASALSSSGGGDWAHSKEINIQDNSGKGLTDYQVLIQLDSSNFDFSQAKSDGSDIRFTLNGAELPYWIEGWDTLNNVAKIWVKVPNIPASGNAEATMYYGNPEANAVGNGDAAFEFFDDFKEGYIDNAKWSKIAGDWQVENGILTHTGTGLVNVPTPDILLSNYYSKNGIAIHSKVKWVKNGYFEDGIIWNYDPKNVNYYEVSMAV